jgi:hypothetical protein
MQCAFAEVQTALWSVTGMNVRRIDNVSVWHFVLPTVACMWVCCLCAPLHFSTLATKHGEAEQFCCHGLDQLSVQMAFCHTYVSGMGDCFWFFEHLRMCVRARRYAYRSAASSQWFWNVVFLFAFSEWNDWNIHNYNFAWCENWSLTCREAHRLRLNFKWFITVHWAVRHGIMSNRLCVSENRVPKKIFGPKQEEVTGDWNCIMRSFMVCTAYCMLWGWADPRGKNVQGMCHDGEKRHARSLWWNLKDWSTSMRQV